MRLLAIYEGHDPRHLIAEVQRGLFQQTWRGSIAGGWYQPKNGKVASDRMLDFLDRQAFTFSLGQQDEHYSHYDSEEERRGEQ